MADAGSHVSRVTEFDVGEWILVSTSGGSKPCEEPAEKFVTHESRKPDGGIGGSRKAGPGPLTQSWGYRDVRENRCPDSQRLEEGCAASFPRPCDECGTG